MPDINIEVIQNFNTEVFTAIVFAVLIVLSLLMRLRKPKERTFKCSRCSKIAEHTPRTIEAWRSGKTKFFCNACHTQWLRSHPAPMNKRTELSRRSGCLGIFAFLLALPLWLTVLLWEHFV